MINKKSEISQVFVYLSTAMVIVIVLGFGFKWLSGLIFKVSEVECVQFKIELERRVSNNLDFGKINTKPIRVDCDFREICFVSDPIMFNPQVNSNYPIINDSLNGNVKNNVFFRNQITESFFYIEELKVENDIKCFNVTNLGLEFKIEGKGNHVLLSGNTGSGGNQVNPGVTE
jgi:hypothetical protein